MKKVAYTQTHKHIEREKEREREEGICRERVNRGEQISMSAFHLLVTDSKYKQVLYEDLIGVIRHFMKSKV